MIVIEYKLYRCFPFPGAAWHYSAKFFRDTRKHGINQTREMFEYTRELSEGRQWAIVRADGVVIAQSRNADVSALKREAA